MKPDESLFKTHLEEAPFQAGADAGKWGMQGDVKNIVWPHPIIWIRSDLAILPVGKVFLRFTVDGYPTNAPTGCPWDVEKNLRLADALWPKVTGKFALVFRHNWQIKTALYAPCDRLAMVGHEGWKQQFPFWWWGPHFTIVKYLDFVHMCLNPLRYEDK